MRIATGVAPIDVVIPAHEKDVTVLRHAVRAALRHIHPLRRVVVVSRRRLEWPDDRVAWVPEPPGSMFPTLLSVGARLASAGPDAAGRASWIYQQILKLGAGAYISELSSRYLVIDSDVVFLRPTSFATEAEARFPYSVAQEYHQPYVLAYTRLFGRAPRTDHSLVAHHMLFDQAFLRDMFKEIEDRHGKPWYDAYVDAAEVEATSSISEYCTYGWWVLERHPEAAQRRQLKWRDVHRVPGPLGRAQLANAFDFVAAHGHSRDGPASHLAGFALRVAAEFWAFTSGPRRRFVAQFRR